MEFLFLQVSSQSSGDCDDMSAVYPIYGCYCHAYVFVHVYPLETYFKKLLIDFLVIWGSKVRLISVIELEFLN